MNVDPELRQYLAGMEERIVTVLKGYVNDRCEEVETKLLTEFHNWASPLEARQRTHTATLRAMDETIEDRVKKLEDRHRQ